MITGWCTRAVATVRGSVVVAAAALREVAVRPTVGGVGVRVVGGTVVITGC